MTVDRHNFLISLAAAMAAAASADGGGTLTLGRELFAGSAHEKTAAATYGVLTITGGPSPDILRPVAEVSVQLRVTSSATGQAMALACRLLGTLYDDAFSPPRPRHSWEIDGKKFASGAIVAGDTNYTVRFVRVISQPGVIQRDERREIVTFNFGVRFHERSAA